MTQIYIDPILNKYRNLIKEKNSQIKTYYFGDPIKIPASNLPALVLAKTDTQVRNETNAQDRHEIKILLTLVTDIREEIKDDKTLAPGVTKLMDIMEGREDDYSLKKSSILDIIRTNTEIDIANNLRTDLGTVTSLSYGGTIGKREPGVWSVEGELELTAHFIQIR